MFSEGMVLALETKPVSGPKNHQCAQLVFFVSLLCKSWCLLLSNENQVPEVFFVWFCLSCETTASTICAQLVKPPKKGHKNGSPENLFYSARMAPKEVDKLITFEVAKLITLERPNVDKQMPL